MLFSKSQNVMVPRINFRSSAKILVASLIAGLLTFLFLEIFGTFEALRLIVGTSLFITLYLLIWPVIGAIDQTDISNLRTLISNFGFFAKLLRVPL